MHFLIKPYLFVLALNLNSSYSQTPTEQIITKRSNYLSDNKKQTALDSVVENAVVDFIQNPQNCGFSIGVIKDTSIYFYNYGETKRDNKILPDKNTIYEIGSISKTFCGIILAYAITEGKIKLDDDIRKYLPGEYPNLETNNHKIEIKHLANHTGGLPGVPENIRDQKDYDSLNPYKNYDKNKLFDHLRTIKLSVEPGQLCEYSNTGMALLGLILERIYNKSFDEIVKEKICIPNQMTSTGEVLSAEQLKRFADGYNNRGNAVPHWDLGAFVAAGGLRSNSNDMIKYIRYNLQEKDAAVKLAHVSTVNKSTNIALAWHIMNTKFNNELTWHNGATFGFSGFCGFIRSKNAGVIVFSNTATGIDFIALAILKFLQK
ncbi:MAG: beta-lactamase family protein [Bacteroidetes bacterium]|nr:beta-lactamase family protein [Bacteroidota bacterium]